MSRDHESRGQREHTIAEVRMQNATYFGLLSRIARNLDLNHQPGAVLAELDTWCSREEVKKRDSQRGAG